MSSQYLYRIQPVRDGFLLESTPEEDAIVSRHFHYLKDLTEQGIVLFAGRTLNTDRTSFGIVLLTAESEAAARAIMQGDPAVVAGVFRAALFPFGTALVGDGLSHEPPGLPWPRHDLLRTAERRLASFSPHAPSNQHLDS